MNSLHARQRSRRLKKLRWALFALLVVPTLVLVVARVVYAPPARLTNAEEVADVFRQIAAGQPLEGPSQALWAHMGPAAVAVKRLASHITDQVENGVRNPDKVYLEGQAETVVGYVGRDSRTALYLLGHICLHGEDDIERAVALVVLRELFPKKNSIYYANHLSLDENPMIALLAREIIAGTYPRGSLKDKLTGTFFPELAQRARPKNSD